MFVSSCEMGGSLRKFETASLKAVNIIKWNTASSKTIIRLSSHGKKDQTSRKTAKKFDKELFQPPETVPNSVES